MNYEEQMNSLRHEAALLIAEIRPLETRLAELKSKHSVLANRIYDLSKQHVEVKKLTPRARKRVSVVHNFKQTFTALPADMQAAMLKMMKETLQEARS